MMGFVSALSSAVSVMVLIMVVILSRKIEIENTNKEKLNSFISDYSQIGSYQSDQVVLETRVLFTRDSVFEVLNKNAVYGISCSYGHSRDKVQADKYSVFNYIYLNKTYENKFFLLESYKSLDYDRCEIRIVENE